MLSKKYLPKLPESPTRKGGEEWQPGAEGSEGKKFFEEEPRLGGQGSSLQRQLMIGSSMPMILPGKSCTGF